MNKYINLGLNYIITSLKYKFSLKYYLIRFFIINSKYIISDTYSKLWKFSNRVEFISTFAENIIVGHKCQNDLILNGYRNERIHNEINCFKFKNPELSSYTGLINLDRKYFFSDMARCGANSIIRLPVKKTLINKTIYLANEKNYYHFLTEDLFNLLMLESIGLDYNIALPKNVRWKNEILTLFGLGDKVLSVPSLSNIHATQAIGVNKDFSGYIHPSVVYSLHCKIRSLVKEENKCKGGMERNIYLSRRKAKSRSFLNETETELNLSKRGFEIIYAEDMTVYDQFKLFAESKIIIAPHGAGLINLLAADSSKCILIEIIDKSHYSFCYRGLCSDLNIDIYNIELNYDNKGKESYLDIYKLNKIINKIHS